MLFCRECLREAYICTTLFRKYIFKSKWFKLKERKKLCIFNYDENFEMF